LALSRTDWFLMTAQPGSCVVCVEHAGHARKSKSKRRDGYRGHVAAELGTGLIANCKLTMARRARQR
jgi:hypothetical protein